MGERNDLIEQLKATRVIWKSGGSAYADFLLPVIDKMEDDAATIASLSEALAEAEKKGAEDEGALAKAIFQADYPTDKWERFARGDVVDERYRLLARAALAHIFPPRDLSQGGQHG